MTTDLLREARDLMRDLWREEENRRIDEMIARIDAALAQPAASEPQAVAPKHDREADRARFPDPEFNLWLDESISDAGHIVWDQIGSVCDAWHGWDNRYFSAAPPAAPRTLTAGWKLVPVEPTDAMLGAGADALLMERTFNVSTRCGAIYRLMLSATPERP